MNVKEYIKTNWKIIVIVILAIFGLSKCASSCSRSQKIKTLNNEISVKDSTISVYEDSIKYLNINNANLDEQLSSERNHSSAYAGVASNNVNSQANKINELSTENRNLKAENAKLQREVKSLKQQVESLTAN